MKVSENSRLFELDALRGIAAFMVVLYHYLYWHGEINETAKAAQYQWASIGANGVQLFFLISGYVIYLTLNKVEKPLDFIVSRFARLYPVFWASVIITFLFINYFGLETSPVYLNGAIANLSMVHEYLGYPHVDGAYWTLTLELTFYFWIFLAFIFSKLDKVEVYLFVSVLLSILGAFDIISFSPILEDFLLINYSVFFISGICIYKILNQDMTRYTLPVLVLCMLAIPVLFTQHPLIYVFIYVTFFAAVSGKLKLLNSKFFIFLGTISYSLYLTHQNIGFILLNNLYEHDVNHAVSFIVVTLFSILLASFLTFYIEKPCAKVIRQVYREKISYFLLHYKKRS